MSNQFQQGLAAQIASEQPEDKIVVALQGEPTWGDLRQIAAAMLIKARTAEVYVQVADTTGYFLPVVLRIDEQGDLIIVVVPSEETR